MPRYRWKSPHEWLDWKLEEVSNDSLLDMAHNLGRLLDSEHIHAEYAEAMEKDGYFREIGEVLGDLKLTIPDLEQGDEPYPGGIIPGVYDLEDIVELLRHHNGNPEAVQFIADMLEP